MGVRKVEERSVKRFSHLSIAAFLEDLSSPDPVPGAGPATAHLGAVAAAVVIMVAGNNLKMASEDASRERFRKVLEEGVLLRDELSDLVGEDADVYFQVMAALDLPRQNDSEKKARDRAIAAAMRVATDIPLQMMARCLATFNLAQILAQDGSKMAAPDALAAAEMAAAGVYACGAMIRANLPRVRDEEYADRALQEVGRMEGELGLEDLRIAVGERVAPK